jgi:hypothetical protein
MDLAVVPVKPAVCECKQMLEDALSDHDTQPLLVKEGAIATLTLNA